MLTKRIGFGYRVAQYDSGWDELVSGACLAEELGFDGIWLNDHFIAVSRSGHLERSTFECWTAAAALAHATRCIRIGFMTLCNGYRLPSIAAKMASSLDVISGGRLELGMGAGWNEDEFRMYGIPYPTWRVRLDQLEEGLQILSGMLENEQFSFSGRHFIVENAYNNPRPVQRPRPPIWIGGGSPRMLRIAARYGDWHNLVLTSASEFRQRMRALDGACRTIGRDPTTLGRSITSSLLLRDTEREFRRYAAERAERRGISLQEYLDLLESQGTIFGGPERAAQTIQAFADAGCSYFVLIIRERDQETALRRFVELVLPRFR